MGSGVAQYFKALSPSNVNDFLEYRPKWFLTKIMKKELPKSPDMFRGSAVENGLTKALAGQLSLQDAKDYAVGLFKSETADLDVDECAKSEAPIPDLVGLGYEALKPYGSLVAVQRKIWVEQGSNTMAGTILPWMGFADFVFEGGVIVDLKVTGRTPSEMSHAHSRQGAFYHKHIPDTARTDFVYLIPLKGGCKSVTHPLKDIDRHLEDLRQGAIAMHEALSFSDNPIELKSFFHPAPGDWWMKDQLTFNTAREIWELAA